MLLREILLWGMLWGDIYRWSPPGPQRTYDYSPEEAKHLKEAALKRKADGVMGGKTIEEVMAMKHTAEGDWFGKQRQPMRLYEFCPASSFQDYYIWKLQRFIKDTKIGALYLDQPFKTCPDAGHGCGYMDYSGKWAGEAPIFARR